MQTRQVDGSIVLYLRCGLLKLVEGQKPGSKADKSEKATFFWQTLCITNWAIETEITCSMMCSVWPNEGHRHCSGRDCEARSTWARFRHRSAICSFVVGSYFWNWEEWDGLCEHSGKGGSECKERKSIEPRPAFQIEISAPQYTRAVWSYNKWPQKCAA